jgi:F0F1-type ATP synthase assembly protein I
MVEPAGKRDPKAPEPALVSMARYSGLGLQLAASVVLFLLGGRWLDGKLGTDPWLTLIGAFVGGAAGFYSLYAHLVRSQDRGGKG